MANKPTEERMHPPHVARLIYPGVRFTRCAEDGAEDDAFEPDEDDDRDADDAWEHDIVPS